MENYIGIKEIKAIPMNRLEYNNHRGWDMPSNENGSDEGYLVEYEDGYQSWSPKNVFEDTYVIKDINNYIDKVNQFSEKMNWLNVSFY